MARASVTAENNAATGLVTAAAFFGLNTADPGTTGASEVVGGSYVRQGITWAAASGGAIANSVSITTPVPASTTVPYFSTWSLVSSGVYQIGGQLSASVTFNTAGSLLVGVGALSATAS